MAIIGGIPYFQTYPYGNINNSMVPKHLPQSLFNTRPLLKPVPSPRSWSPTASRWRNGELWIETTAIWWVFNTCKTCKYSHTSNIVNINNKYFMNSLPYSYFHENYTNIVNINTMINDNALMFHDHAQFLVMAYHVFVRQPCYMCKCMECW